MNFIEMYVLFRKYCLLIYFLNKQKFSDYVSSETDTWKNVSKKDNAYCVEFCMIGWMKPGQKKQINEWNQEGMERSR